MIVLAIVFLSLWISMVFLGVAWILFRVILPKYKITVSDVGFNELLMALNASINTELELWEKDVFHEQTNMVATNSKYENYYHEITGHIISTLSPIFFENISKYITEEAVISIIGRRVKIFLNDHSSTI